MSYVFILHINAREPYISFDIFTYMRETMIEKHGHQQKYETITKKGIKNSRTDSITMNGGSYFQIKSAYKYGQI